MLNVKKQKGLIKNVENNKDYKKDNKGRNNINKKDHQLKFTSLVDENTSNKILNQKEENASQNQVSSSNEK